MSVTYALSREDLLHYYHRAVARSFLLPPGAGFVCGMCLFVIGSFGVMMLSGQTVEAVFTYNILSCSLITWGVIIAWHCSTPRLRVIIERQASTNPSLFSEVCVSISPVCVTATSIYGDEALRWQAVHQITSDAECIYLSAGFLDRIVPKSAFASASEAQSFLTSATEYWMAAKQMPLETQAGVWPPAPRLGA